jgi:hypothetical protein
VRRRGTEFLAGGASGAAATHSFGRILRGGANARRGETRGGAAGQGRGGAAGQGARRGSAADPPDPRTRVGVAGQGGVGVAGRTGGGGQFGGGGAPWRKVAGKSAGGGAI